MSSVFKRILTAILSLVLLLSGLSILAACGTPTPDTTPDTPDEVASLREYYYQ